MSQSDNGSWPKTADGVTDWEEVFEDPAAGLIPLISEARTPSALRESAIVVIKTLYARTDDPAEIERFTSELTRIIADDTAEESLPRIAAAVIGILRHVKEDRKQKAAEFVTGREAAKKGERRSRTGKQRKPAPPKDWPLGRPFFWGGALGIVGIGVAAYLFVAGLDSPDEPKPSLLLIEQMKGFALGDVPETHAFGGKLQAGKMAGRTFISAEGIPPDACQSAAWVLLNRGTIVINGVMPKRPGPRVLNKLCTANESGATLTWFPKEGSRKRK